MPRYAEVYDDLRQRILNGEWAIGDQLPDLGQLMVQYSTSLTTVRRATTDLRDRGVLRIARGEGTFVIALPEQSNEEMIVELRAVKDAVTQTINKAIGVLERQQSAAAMAEGGEG
ncbi:GntR family transcriptional regulator [Streptomyces sp. H39-S7]|uniref:GntR family transcriptional regulator n=1 Tax=Streptomyces sp. H39-S7 TaxID=3004357 RepID=UPI0022AE5831|nr:GntR family transcriptional regulator [Streptomyces sp. H39-S7]MCZ4124974.1 GntR family transcriptional regulator [Streptomyces sp. H39-S7]